MPGGRGRRALRVARQYLALRWSLIGAGHVRAPHDEKRRAPGSSRSRPRPPRQRCRSPRRSFRGNWPVRSAGEPFSAELRRPAPKPVLAVIGDDDRQSTSPGRKTVLPLLGQGGNRAWRRQLARTLPRGGARDVVYAPGGAHRDGRRAYRRVEPPARRRIQDPDARDPAAPWRASRSLDRGRLH